MYIYIEDVFICSFGFCQLKTVSHAIYRKGCHRRGLRQPGLQGFVVLGRRQLVRRNDVGSDRPVVVTDSRTAGLHTLIVSVDDVPHTAHQVPARRNLLELAELACTMHEAREHLAKCTLQVRG